MSIFKRLLSALFALVMTFSPSGDKNTVPDVTEHVHKYAETVTYATCTESGYTTYSCACGDTYNENYIDPLGHSYIEAITVEASCAEDGLKTFTCSICGDSYSEAIPAVGHTYEDTVTAPTCGVAGYTTHTCNSCGDFYIDSEVPALEHFYSRTDMQEETCTEPGYKIFTCDHCGDSYKTILDPYHPSDRVWYEPTCEEEGYYFYTCIICGYTHKGDFVPAVGHSYEESVTAPTCEEGGYTAYTCTACGDSYIDNETDAIGHTYMDTVVGPGCTTDGYTSHVCSDCGDSNTDSEVPAVGHAWGDWIVTKEADEDVEGSQERTCNTCGEVEMEVIPEIHYHSFVVTSQTEPTCTEKGVIYRACACGETNHTSVEEALGHDWESHYQAEIGHYEAYIYCHCGNWSYRVADSDYDLAFADHVDADHNGAWWDWSYYSRNIWVVDVPGYNYKVCTRCGEEK